MRRQFEYHVTTKDGKRVKGEIAATNFKKAATLLKIKHPGHKDLKLKSFTDNLNMLQTGRMG